MFRIYVFIQKMQLCDTNANTFLLNILGVCFVWWGGCSRGREAKASRTGFFLSGAFVGHSFKHSVAQIFQRIISSCNFPTGVYLVYLSGEGRTL